MGWLTSDKDEAVKNLMRQQQALGSEIGRQNFDVKNIFADYKSPYSGDAQLSQLGSYYGKRRASANKMFGRDAGRAGSNTGRMIASQGLTGSAALDAVNKAKDGVLNKKYSYLDNLDTSQAGQKLNIMNSANAENFRIANANQGMLTKNVDNLIRQYGLRNGSINSQAQLANQLDPTTLWDDALTVGRIVAPAAASDKNVKENIIDEGTSRLGLPIISFNYIWDKTRRYIGTIAQEVEKIIPEAVIERDGIKMVKYSLIDVPFYEV